MQLVQTVYFGTFCALIPLKSSFSQTAYALRSSWSTD